MNTTNVGNQTVGEIVAEDLSTTRVFKHFGI